MAKYRKKPVVIDAIQYVYANIGEIKEFVGDKLKEEPSNTGAVGYFIETLEGNSYLISNKDWIIKGVNGEFYPCKNDIFQKTYEAV